jgi:plastocyanin
MSDDRTAAKVAAAGTGSFTVGEALAQVPLGPKSTASPGPGAYSGGSVDFSRLGIKSNETFGNFGCTVFKENPNTPDWQTANAYFERGIHNVDLDMPDGAEVRCWAFEDRLKARGKEIFPSPPIRVQEGDLVHVKLSSSKGSHTIHHHGIEPTTMNDGVGHVSMEVSGSYIYQFQPKHAGTYFYHCHKNTVTHFEMGLYGLLIVDPKPINGAVVHAYGPREDGSYRPGEEPRYEAEYFWVLDDIDPRWHRITNFDHDVGLCGDDSGLNIFQPKYFLLSGTPSRFGRSVDKHRIRDAKRTGRVLIRLLNASYGVLRIVFNGIAAQVISVDGHALDKPWNRWMTIPAGQEFYLQTAQRYDILLDFTPSGPNAHVASGTYKVEFEFENWLTCTRQNHFGPAYQGYLYTVVEV